MAVEVVVAVKYPHGFDGSVGVVQDVPVMFQLTAGHPYILGATEKLIGRFNPPFQ